MYRYFRSIRTKAEKRDRYPERDAVDQALMCLADALGVNVEDLNVEVRFNLSRAIRNREIPDAWDDIPHARRSKKSWKEQGKRKRPFDTAPRGVYKIPVQKKHNEVEEDEEFYGRPIPGPEQYMLDEAEFEFKRLNDMIEEAEFNSLKNMSVEDQLRLAYKMARLAVFGPENDDEN
jgi:hypothetical protein